MFDRLQGLSIPLQPTPEDLDSLESKITTLQVEFSSWLGPVQVNLFHQKKQEVIAVRQQRARNARQWLIDLENRHKSGAEFGELLREAQNPPAFLSAEDRSRLEQLIQTLQKEIEKDRLLKIETLFKELDIETRRTCLRRLMDLVDKP